MVVGAVVGAIAALVCIIIACRTRSGAIMGVMVGLALLFMAPVGLILHVLHPEWIDGRYRTCKAFYADITVGMTQEQVVQLMEEHYPKTGSRQRPKMMQDDASKLGFNMNPESSTEPNCEGILLMFEKGKVVKKEYLPD